MPPDAGRRAAGRARGFVRGSGVHPIDNAPWHALHGPQATLAERHGDAARYQPDITPFAALPDAPAAAAWDDLRALVGPGAGTVLFRAEIEPGPGWTVLFAGTGEQMLAPETLRITRRAADTPPLLALGPDDVDDMLELVARTRPGPFLRRTIALGTYLGYRDDAGKLVALAGERLHVDGYTEVSAVCTDPDVRGRGLATALIEELVTRISARGETPFLHVATENDTARSLYETLGFTVRRTVEFAGLRAPA
jgi:ribosomal protein S18 acetylase RimI-like enzyme